MNNDRQIIVVDKGDPDELSDLQICKEVGDVLCKHYPDHPWVVCAQGRGIVVRHLAIAAEVAARVGREGFSTLLPRDKLGTPKQIAHSAMTFGGQMLEAFQLPRGKWDGRDPIVPESWTKTTRKFQ